MDRPTPSRPNSLPFAQASAAQLAQAILAARGALSIYYPNLTVEQWLEAFRKVGLSLHIVDSWATVTAPGLHSLIEFLESQYSNAQMPSKAVEPGQNTVRQDAPPPPGQRTAKKVKKTYEMEAEVLEVLNRVSFWQRVGKAQLVNKAIRQLLANLPEAQMPIPGVSL